MESKTITIAEDRCGVRLDRFLAETFPNQSRSHLQRLIDRDMVTVNGESVKKKRSLAVGDMVQITIPEERVAQLHPEDCDLDILYQDDSVVVVNKPAGMVVHPGAGNREGTLVNKLLGLNYEQFLAMMDEEERPGIVHRLDKDTSGVMIIAKTPIAKHRLSKQFEERLVRKRYLAIAKGHLPYSNDFRVETGIRRHPVHRKKMMACTSGGRQAISIFNVIDDTETVSLIQASILTGRTHQIRVHLTHVGCPILGDAVYGKTAAMAPRQMLHAWKLSITHPDSEELMTFIAPPPEDFIAVMKDQGLSFTHQC